MASISIEVRKNSDKGLDIIDTILIEISREKCSGDWFWMESVTGTAGTGFKSEENAAKAAETHFGGTRRLSQPRLN